MVAMTELGKRRASSHRGRDESEIAERLRELKERATEVASSVRETAAEATETVKQKAGDMGRAISGTVKEEAERLFEEQKGKAASKVKRYGKVIQQAAHALKAVKAQGLAEYADAAAERVEGVTEYLEERNLAQVLQDAGEVARKHPGMTIGGMFIAGFALARFLKASASREDEGDEEEEGDESPRQRNARR